jgi:hypothetical protein
MNHRSMAGPAVAATSVAVCVAALAGPVLGAGLLARAGDARERRDRTVSLLRGFLDEPMASTRRAAWAFLQTEGDAVRHFSHYYRTDPAYGDPDHQVGVVALLKVLLFQRTVQDLRDAGALDEQLYQALLEPHRRAWTGYTSTMAARSASHPDAVTSGDASLFTWRAD